MSYNNSTEFSIELNSSFMMSISVTIVITNAIPSWIIISISKIRQNLSNKFLLNLLLSHLFTGLSYVLVTTIHLFKNQKFELQEIHASAEMVTEFAMITLTTDRFLCIRYSFQYEQLPQWLCYLMMFSCWFLGTIHFIISSSSSAFDGFEMVKITFLVISSIAVMALFINNTLIFKETLRQIKEISVSITHKFEPTNASSISVNDTKDNISQVVDSNRKANAEFRKQFIKVKEIRAAYICVLMATSFIIFWVPLLVVSFVEGYMSQYLVPTIYLVIMNAIVDPVIYTIFNRNVRSNLIRRTVNKHIQKVL